ncbi:MAG: replication-relaxation family protein, partial [Thaumarchaeota archaeon]|nr:replication-relaxation family protein [Nitrososphaerota archaeon]
LQALLQGPKTSNQIMVVIDRSREHTGRVMKILYEKGLVTRNTDRTRPFVYQVTESGRRYLENP